MCNQDEIRKVDYCSVEFEVVSDSSMDYNTPFLGSVIHFLASSHTDAIPPKVSDFLVRVLELISFSALVILDLLEELVVEYFGICLNVNTWFIMLEVLFNQHEVRVKLDSTILSQDSTYHVAFSFLSLSI